MGVSTGVEVGAGVGVGTTPEFVGVGTPTVESAKLSSLSTPLRRSIDVILDLAGAAFVSTIEAAPYPTRSTGTPDASLMRTEPFVTLMDAVHSASGVGNAVLPPSPLAS